MVQSTGLVTASVATAATVVLAYAVYFDYKRRNEAEFRRNLRRNERRQARVEKEEAEQSTKQFRAAIHAKVDEAKEEGIPTDLEEREAYFKEQMGIGEALSADPTKATEAALGLYKCLKVHPSPGDLIALYDSVIPKPVLDVLAEMIAYDSSLDIRSSGINLSDIPSVGLD
ncbi:mitochondrial outer membrane translocase complex, subunit Tom20 domain-containing protein [Stachybotrys elegans]|uniref:Mitochondrial outer membrane translocase complex, subunit Tom20 domain-containing protein n=1 Tax=Stachybotrys elegans TaxID=80388 RepID=A0A8K0WXR4_9HYPO|nr:mitochondrial outer membrane translocase complex, subunit Tom20 domain-containing protein [Stachybotrys elegans]